MVQELKKIDFFSGLTDAQLKKIKRICHKQKHTTGERIFKEGTTSPALFIIMSGAVKIVKKLEGQKVYEPITLIKEGKFFGDLSFMDGRPHSTSSIAVRDTQLLVIKKEDFDKLAKSDALLAYEITKNIASDLIRVLRSMDEKFISMMKYVWDRSSD